MESEYTSDSDVMEVTDVEAGFRVSTAVPTTIYAYKLIPPSISNGGVRAPEEEAASEPQGEQDEGERCDQRHQRRGASVRGEYSCFHYLSTHTN